MLDSKQLEEIHKKYNPEGSALRNYQKHILRILVEFDAFCKKHGLSYSLAFGTLLGAVRHGGYIPWDDDLDVIMTREQYKAFESVVGDLSSVIDVDKVYLDGELYVRRRLKPEICINCIGMIDLFIVDYAPNSKVKQLIKRTTIQLVQWLYRSRWYYESWRQGGHPHRKLWQVLTPIGLCLSIRQWQRVWDKVMMWFMPKNVSEQRIMCCYTAAVRDIPKIYSVDVFNETIEMDFEGYKFPCIKEYDKFLSIRYGNYMEMPKTISNHRRVTGK